MYIDAFNILFTLNHLWGHNIAVYFKPQEPRILIGKYARLEL